MKPVEGTILTVIRESSWYANHYFNEHRDLTIEEYFDKLIEYAKDSLEHIAAVMKELYSKAVSEPEAFRGFPVTAPVSRPDELKAAKDLKLTFDM